MKTQIDIKSALCGLAVGIVAMLALGATDAASNRFSRYQCSSGSNIMLIVDTTTGQAWGLQPGGVTLTGSPGGFFDKKAD